MLSNDDIGLPVVRANNINDGQLNLVDDIKYWYKNDPQGANTNNYLIEQGDILINFINSEAKMGTAAYVTRRPERDTIYTTNILRCKVNDEYNPYFIYSLTFLNSYKNYIASITKPAVNQASFTTVDFKKYSIKIPTVKEQNQIADLIETFNKLITLHLRKLDNLKLKKKALLQKLFPKNGERYPELRFPGFTDAWEQRKLSDILKVNSGKDYKHLDQGNIPVYGTGGYMLSVNESLSNIDAIGIGRKGTIDKPQYLKAPFWTVDTLFYLTALDKHSILFLYYLMQLIPWKKFDESTGVPSLSKTTIDNISGFVPSNSQEEELISALFNQLDKSITLHQRKLDHLQLQKKALLQQMFV